MLFIFGFCGRSTPEIPGMVIGAAWVGQVRRGRIELLIADRFLIRQTGLGWPSSVVRPIKSKEVMPYYVWKKN